MLAADPVGVVFFEYIFPRAGHSIWSNPGVKLVVWDRGPKPFSTPPVGWRVQTLSFRHPELGGVTDGVFHVRVGSRTELNPRPPRAVVGVSPTLRQVLNPTISGEPLQGDGPGAGDINTARGLLGWSRRRDNVVAASVFPQSPWVIRPLTNDEFLAAMDVPATRIKDAGEVEKTLWRKELRLPFKVRMEVCDWVCSAGVERGDHKRAASADVPLRAAKRIKGGAARDTALTGMDRGRKPGGG